MRFLFILLSNAFILLSGLLTVDVGATDGKSGKSEAGVVLATVNSEAVTLEHLNIELNSFLSIQEGNPNAKLPTAEETLRRLIQNRLLEQEGYRIGSDETPVVKNQVTDYLRRQGVVALLDSISDDVARLGEAQLDSMMDLRQSMRRYSHILVEEEGLAKSLKDSLEQGADFGDLARRHSTDATVGKGGDLGWAAAGAYVPEFEAGAAALEIGEVSEPVKTEFGWHLVKLTETRDETFGQSPEMRKAMMQALEQENRMAAAREFVTGLRAKYNVVIDDSLLASLDFGSEDPEVLEKLRNSEEVLTVLPTGRLTVKGLNRTILFTYFHGLSGRENADAIRDKVFNEWIVEALLSYEAQTLGKDKKPELLFKAEQIERRLMREEVLNTVLNFRFDPDEDEIEHYFESQRHVFTEAPTVKVNSVWLESESAARKFKSKLEQGAQMDWLAAREPGVLMGENPFPDAWLELDELGLAGKEVEIGTIVGPLQLEKGWALAELVAVTEGREKALDECRREVLARMKRDRTRNTLSSALERLENEADIELNPDAESVVAARLKEYEEILEKQQQESSASPGGRASRETP